MTLPPRAVTLLTGAGCTGTAVGAEGATCGEDAESRDVEFKTCPKMPIMEEEEAGLPSERDEEDKEDEEEDKENEENWSWDSGIFPLKTAR